MGSGSCTPCPTKLSGGQQLPVVINPGVLRHLLLVSWNSAQSFVNSPLMKLFSVTQRECAICFLPGSTLIQTSQAPLSCISSNSFFSPLQPSPWLPRRQRLFFMMGEWGMYRGTWWILLHNFCLIWDQIEITWIHFSGYKENLERVLNPGESGVGSKGKGRLSRFLLHAYFCLIFVSIGSYYFCLQKTYIYMYTHTLYIICMYICIFVIHKMKCIKIFKIHIKI